MALAVARKRRGQNLELMGKQPLIDQAHAIAARVKGDRSVMASPPADRDIHCPEG
jgi:hypothetical protein